MGFLLSSATVAPSHLRAYFQPSQEVLRFACLTCIPFRILSGVSAGIDRAKGSAGICFSEGARAFKPKRLKQKLPETTERPAAHTSSSESEHTGKPILTRGTIKI